MKRYLPLLVCVLFGFAFSLLGIIKHLHFLSGYDLAVIDQAIWKYSQFKAPISTNHAYPFTLILTDHVELIFILLAPLYWIWNNVIGLILLQSIAATSAGYAVFLFAKHKKIHISICYALLINFFLFYGMQNALWSDVHSLVFGVAFLSWFLYCIETKKTRAAALFFILTIISKEDMALLTAVISAIYFWQTKKKNHLLYLVISLVYLAFIFGVYFPHFVNGGYRFQSKSGLLSHIAITDAWNTKDKRDVWLYSFASFGFLPLFAPVYLLPTLADLLKYFVVANTVVTAGQGLFGHYRITLALLLGFPTIIFISKNHRANKSYTAGYLLVCALFFQYTLHLPLSYLTKKWFWQTSPAVTTINTMLTKVPAQSSLVTPVNIAPHVAHRDEAFIFWPTVITPKDNPNCHDVNCDWLRWPGHPQYLLVDLSPKWDARHLLTNNENFQRAIQNLEKGHVIKKDRQIGTTILFKILKNP